MMNKILEPNVSAVASPEPRSWEQLKERLLKIFTLLTEADLNFEESNKDEMIELLQIKLGKTRREIIAIIEII